MAVIRDKDWVRRSFLSIAEDPNATKNPRAAATFTSAAYKYTGTGIGENFSLNNVAQYSPLADPRVKGRMPGNSSKPINTSSGMGMYFSEAIDDNSHLIYLRYGHASFNSISSFVDNIFSYDASLMANTGRKPGIFYAAGYATGVVTALPFLGYIMFAKGLSLIYGALTGGVTSNNYMTIKPAMYEFWGAVQWVYNSIGVNQEIVWPYETDHPDAIDTEIGKKLHNLAPDIISESGLVDIFDVALRAQRLANENRRNILQVIDSVGDQPDMMMAQLKALETSPINTSNIEVTVGGVSDIFPEFGCLVYGQKRGGGQMFEADLFRCKAVGMPINMTPQEFSEAEVTVQAFYDANRNGIMKLRSIDTY